MSKLKGKLSNKLEIEKSMKKRGEDTLMLVEDQEDTLRTLCIFGDQDITKEIFTIEYEKLKGRYKPIHRKHADTHFYSLTTFKFLVSSGIKGVYHQSEISKELCELQNNPERRDEYQKKISRMLLNNEKKGKLFQDFLDFTKEKKTREEIFEHFKNEFTARALIAWLKYAGLIIESENYFQSIEEQKKEITEEIFRDYLIKIYYQLQDPHRIGVKRIAVPIGEIRFHICVELNLTEFEFDKILRKLLDKDVNHTIRLHGATSDAFENEPTFRYLNKLYIYLSFKDY